MLNYILRQLIEIAVIIGLMGVLVEMIGRTL
jgi:hypothetical protein